MFSRSRCFLPKSPKTDKIYFVNTLRCLLIFLLYFTLGTFWTLNQPLSNHVIIALKAAVSAGIFCRLQVAGCRLKQLVYLSQSRINPNIEANRKQPKLI